MTQAPAWELKSEYPSIESKEFQSDFATCETMIAEFPAISSAPTVSELITAIVREREISTLLENLGFQAMNLAAENTKDEVAKKWSKKIKDTEINLSVKYLPYQLAIQELSDSDFQKLILSPEVEGEKFILQRNRLLKEQMLSREEEIILEKMSGPAAYSWSDLYEKVCSAMEVEVEMNGKKTTMSLPQAQALTKGYKEEEKRAAWIGMQKAWKIHEQAPAQSLNAMADWAFRKIELRAKKKRLHFLDGALHRYRISRQSLDTMQNEIEKALPQLQKTMIEMAKILGKPKLDSWDLICAGPESTAILSFADAFAKIEKGFQSVDPELAQFARMMLEKRWIEARDIENKAGGGYCMCYPKSRTPRIFQTFKGSYTDIFTVAHELGHAFHYWVMRDLPLRQGDYPSTLAETASNFAEFALFDYLRQEEGQTQQVRWLFLEGIQGSLINVVARYHFEKQFYEKYESEGALSAQEISDLQVQVWKKWYGDTLNQIDTHFWANKQHFYWPGPNFYNFPYTVGYLFSQSIYAQRERLGKEFWPRYKALLRDTGIMTCEDIVKKHLGLDIREPQFWREGLQSLVERI